MRLDVYLHTVGLASSRTRAQELIAGGFVTVSGKIVRKPSLSVEESALPEILVTGQLHPFVGRGGVKLEGALTAFSIDPTGAICADIGASTGGFTDCLLRHGAARVFAVDSGSDQLAQSLRENARVVNIEHFNARNLMPETLGTLCDMAVADLSFISQTYVLANISAILREGGIYIGLIKPQFECGVQALDRHGIVKAPAEHRRAIMRVRDAAFSAALLMRRVIVSPITGGDGNREFLCLCEKMRTPGGVPIQDSEIDRLVRE